MGSRRGLRAFATPARPAHPFPVLSGSPLNPGLSLYWGLQWVDAASTFDLSVPRQGLVGAVIHGFQVSQLHRCAWEFSSYRIILKDSETFHN
ncbi:hypothetical protein CB1_000195018 [Camelus ferus]|nr:hypothetical protein CB1_000195018 [Camelus ferus]